MLFSRKDSGQGTIEYLIIIAIVVVIALVVVGLLTGFFATGSGVTTTQQTIGQQTQILALTDIVTNKDGNYILQLKSNELDPITITKITIDGQDQNYYSNNTLLLGSEIIFPISTNTICNEGTNTNTKTITITYIQKGIIRTYNYKNVNTLCQDYQLSSNSNIAGTTPTTNTTSPEEPDPITFTVTYDGNNGTCTPLSRVINSGEDSTAPSCSRTGYTLTGFQRTSGSGGTLNTNTGAVTDVTGDQTISAQWEEVETFTLTFDSQGGTDVDSIEGISAGSTVTLPSPPTKEEYAFVEWNTSSDGSGTEFTTSTTVNEDLTIYAQWREANGIIQISTCSGLQNMDQNLSGQYELISNVDCSGVTFSPVGSSSSKFTGSLNGNYFKIQNLTITNSSSVENIGLFGFIENATISKLVMENPSIDAFRYIGSIAGTAKDSTISECGISLDIDTGAFERGLHYGGLIGRLEGGLVEKCYMKGTIISGGFSSGGIVGYLIGGTISDCYVNGDLAAAREGSGGLVGGYYNTSISEIKNSYSRGTANAGYQGYAAGITSAVWDSAQGLTINDSYSLMTVSGNNKGGLVSSSKATVNNSFYTTTGNFNFGTLVSDPTVFLEDTHAVYSEWDFDEIWALDSEINDGYPYLQWELEIN